jgi:hypothetical protein
MSIRSKLLAIAAVSALTAATAIPASALENEFHGMFGLRATNSNYVNGGGTGYLFSSAGVADGVTTKNWVEQRARIFYSAKANDTLKLVTAFELDSTWGKDSYTVDRANGGSALGADTINLETKWVYLDFNVPSTPVNVKAGLQGLNDSYKGLFVGAGADAAGVVVTAPAGPATLTAGWFRLDDRTVAPVATTATSVNITNTSGNAGNVTFTDGKKTRDLFLVDGKIAITKDIKVGGSYYMVMNNGSQQSATNANVPAAAITTSTDYLLHVLGANVAAAVGPASLDGYFLYEFGNMNTTKQHINSFAANVAGKVKIGSLGAVKANLLFVDGGNSLGGKTSNQFININNETSAAFSENGLGGSFGNMFLLVRNSGVSTNDQYIAYESSNRGMGILGGSAGFDATITDKLFVNSNAGILYTAKKQNNKNSCQGLEINTEVGYKVYDNLTASVQGAYVFLGSFYRNGGIGSTRPSDPYVGRIQLSYVF